MQVVSRYHLGEIVGSATAGTNGNTAGILTPSGCKVVFTGMRVLNLDGSRFHLLGVQPTIPVSRTIRDIEIGRDPDVEKALDYVRGRLGTVKN